MRYSNAKVILAITLIIAILLAGCASGPVSGQVTYNGTTVAFSGTVDVSGAAATTASGGSGIAGSHCGSWEAQTYPATVWRSDVAHKDSRYDVKFDPCQGGSADHPALGWYYQPNLPSPASREAHEVAITMRGPATYRYTGPECSVYWNWDGNHPFDSGRLLIDRENKLDGIQLQPNSGAEIWLFVRCNEGAASGFSFEALTPLP